jgi:hypothetical protein
LSFADDVRAGNEATTRFSFPELAPVVDPEFGAEEAAGGCNIFAIDASR